MKTEWLITDLTSVRSLDRAERENLGMLSDVFWSVQAAIAIVVGEWGATL